jgi:hypothetical protein
VPMHLQYRFVAIASSTTNATLSTPAVSLTHTAYIASNLIQGPVL